MNLILPKVTISIPTFNRSVRLERALQNLLSKTIHSSYKEHISVFVSNNGSVDDTNSVIKKYFELFNLNNIPFNYDIKLKNEGFDKNIFNCYIKARTDYIWIISDDDNIYDESIDKIFNIMINYYKFKQT